MYMLKTTFIRYYPNVNPTTLVFASLYSYLFPKTHETPLKPIIFGQVSEDSKT